MRTSILILIISLLVVGCKLTKQQRRDNRVARKIERLKQKYPDSFERVVETVHIDTILGPVRVETQVEVDTVRIDSILIEHVRDTIVVPEIRRQIVKSFVRDTVRVDTLGIGIKAYADFGGLTLEVEKKEQRVSFERPVETVTVTKTEVIRKRFYQDWLFWLIVIVVAGIIIFRGALITYIKRITPRL